VLNPFMIFNQSSTGVLEYSTISIGSSRPMIKLPILFDLSNIRVGSVGQIKKAGVIHYFLVAG